VERVREQSIGGCPDRDANKGRRGAAKVTRWAGRRGGEIVSFGRAVGKETVKKKTPRREEKRSPSQKNGKGGGGGVGAERRTPTNEEEKEEYQQLEE